MSTRSTLLFPFVSLLIIGCGNSLDEWKTASDPLKKQAYEYAKEEARSKSFSGETLSDSELAQLAQTYLVRLEQEENEKVVFKNTPKMQYLFNDTLNIDWPSPVPGMCGSGSSYRGVISNQFKQTATKLWKRLESEGFTGFDVTHLNESSSVSYFAQKNHSCPQDKSLQIPQAKTSWIENLVDQVANLGNRYSFAYLDYLKNLGPSATLVGLTHKGRHVMLVESSPREHQLVFSKSFRTENGEVWKAVETSTPEAASAPVNSSTGTPTPLPDHSYQSFGSTLPQKEADDQPVSQEQIDAWNQIFFDVFKDDAFLKDHYTFPTPSNDQSADVSTSASRNPTTGVNAQNLTLNGNELGNLQFNLPIDCQLAGNINGTTTENLSALTTYKAGNTVVGYIHTYDNTARTPHTQFHTENSLLLTQCFASCFVEVQLGQTSNKQPHVEHVGTRAQLKLGADTPWGTPFAQLTHRNLDNYTDTTSYAGWELSKLAYASDNSTLTFNVIGKVGYHSQKGYVNTLNTTTTFSTSSGLTVSTGLRINADHTANVKFNLSLTR